MSLLPSKPAGSTVARPSMVRREHLIQIFQSRTPKSLVNLFVKQDSIWQYEIVDPAVLVLKAWRQQTRYK